MEPKTLFFFSVKFFVATCKFEFLIVFFLTELFYLITVDVGLLLTIISYYIYCVDVINDCDSNPKKILIVCLFLQIGVINI